MNQKIPKHVAIIMDGNGRWATNRGLPRIEGHRAGVEAVRVAVRGCLNKGIQILSLFAFSSENWIRPKQEVDFLMNLLIETIDKEVSSLHEEKVKIVFLGDKSQLSDLFSLTMDSVESLTANNDRLVLNLAINYGGRWDILQAAQALALSVARGEIDPHGVDETLFSQYLSTQGMEDPDLLIRTSGEERISNFFLWQLAYAELYFTKILWPDFSDALFESALEAFSSRKRRYGNTVEVELVTNV